VFVQCEPTGDLPGKMCRRCIERHLLCEYVKVGSEGPPSTSSDAGGSDDETENIPRVPVTFPTDPPNPPSIPVGADWAMSSFPRQTALAPYASPLPFPDRTVFPLEAWASGYIPSSTTRSLPQPRYPDNFAHIEPLVAYAYPISTTSLHGAPGPSFPPMYPFQPSTDLATDLSMNRFRGGPAAQPCTLNAPNMYVSLHRKSCSRADHFASGHLYPSDPRSGRARCCRYHWSTQNSFPPS
jgi:hypothetical protein